ncbi:MAG: hypothetical protein II304_11455 [Bacteroidales bacterium]|nr:hypothetical protein [Bacteroidales bacterium]
MLNQDFWEKQYKQAGYTCLGWINISTKAQEAYHKSKNTQWHEIGRNLHLIACHDLKSYMMVDSGD